MGVAPLEPMEIPIGTRDVVVKHAQHGEKRATLQIRRDETVEITLGFGPAADEEKPVPMPAPLSAPPDPRPR